MDDTTVPLNASGGIAVCEKDDKQFNMKIHDVCLADARVYRGDAKGQQGVVDVRQVNRGWLVWNRMITGVADLQYVAK